jgi:hypothetical protein
MDSDKVAVDKMTNSELIEIMWQALNKSSLKGVFMINESFLLKLVHAKLVEKTCNTISD